MRHSPEVSKYEALVPIDRCSKDCFFLDKQTIFVYAADLSLQS